jgi:hypothetical protein
MFARRVGWAATFAIAALMLSAAALVNGYPLLFTDSVYYLVNGERLILAHWSMDQRPVFYGAAIWFLHAERSLWPIVLVQGLISAHLIWVTLRSFDLKPSGPAFLAIVGGLVVATPLSWYVSHVMPDLFAGIMLLALFLLGFCGRTLSRGETLYLVVLAALSICFHMSNLPVALAFIGTGWVLARRLRVPAPQLAGFAGPVVLALVISLTYSWCMYREFSLTLNAPPFLLARIVADGPGKAYLAASCAERRFVLCKYRDRLPDTEVGFLWHFHDGLYGTPDYRAIEAEQGAIVAGTARMFPLWMLANAVRGSWHELLTIDSRASLSEAERSYMEETLPWLGSESRHSLQARTLLTSENLAVMNRIHAACILLGLVLDLLFVGLCLRRRAMLPVLLSGCVAAGLVVNAAVTGAISGLDGRYTGRMIWLVAFCAVIAGWTAWRTHRAAVYAGAACDGVAVDGAARLAIGR